MIDTNILIDIKGVSKTYSNKTTAIFDLNLTINRGITALIGPNGSGKTTLIKLLIGLSKCTKGEIKVLDFDSWKDSSKIKEIVSVSLENQFLPSNLTVEKFLNSLSFFQDKSKYFDSISKNFQNLPLNSKINELSSCKYF